MLNLSDFSMVDSKRKLLDELKSLMEGDVRYYEYMWIFAQERELELSTLVEAGAYFIPDDYNLPDHLKWSFNKFLGRLIYPVYNSMKEQIGIVGWDKFEYPKYLDYKDDGYTAKAFTLYGMEKMEEYYATDEVVFIVEGVVDCLRLRENGFNALALLGSSYSPYVVQVIKRLKNPVVIPDMDSAGDGLAKITGYLFNNKVPVLRIGEVGQDLDDYLKTNKQTNKKTNKQKMEELKMRAQIISGSKSVIAAKRSQKRLGRFRDWLTKGRRFKMIMRLDKSNPDAWSFMTSAAFGHSIGKEFAKDLGHRYFIPSTMQRDPDTYQVIAGQKPDVFLKAHIITKTMLQAEYAKRVYEVMNNNAFSTQVEKEAALKSIEVEYNGEKDANGKYTKNPDKYPIVSNPQLRNFAMAVLVDEDKNKDAVYESAEVVTLNPSDKRVVKLAALADACRIDYLKEKNKNPDLEEPEFFEVYFVLPMNSEEKKILGKVEPQEIDFRVYLANVDKDNYDRELKGLLEFLPRTYDELLMHCVDFQDYDENKFWSVLRLQVLINANDLKFVSDPDELEYIKKRANILTEILPEDSSPVLKEAMEEIRKEELLKKAREVSALEEESNDITKSSDDEDEEQIVAKAKASEEAPTPTLAPEATQPKSLEESLADSYVL